MKKFILIFAAVLAFAVSSAQHWGMGPGGMHGGPGRDGGDRSQRQQMMKERIKAALEMTDEQADKFVPLYMNYQKDVSNIRKELKQLMAQYNEKGEIDDKTAFRMCMDQLKADADIIQCKKEHLRVFKDYLTPAQLSKVFMIENERRGGRGGHGPRPGGQNPGEGQGEKPQQAQ